MEKNSLMASFDRLNQAYIVLGQTIKLLKIATDEYNGLIQ